MTRTSFMDVIRDITELVAVPSDFYTPVVIQKNPIISDSGWIFPVFRLPYIGEYNIELIVDKRDFIPLSTLNTNVLNAYAYCSNPGRVSGYAGDFNYRAHGYGFRSENNNFNSQKISEIVRPYGKGYRLISFVSGKDLPINKPIKCDIRLTEWMLESGPSYLYVFKSKY